MLHLYIDLFCVQGSKIVEGSRRKAKMKDSLSDYQEQIEEVERALKSKERDEETRLRKYAVPIKNQYWSVTMDFY